MKRTLLFVATASTSPSTFISSIELLYSPPECDLIALDLDGPEIEHPHRSFHVVPSHRTAGRANLDRAGIFNFNVSTTRTNRDRTYALQNHAALVTGD